MRNWKLIVIGAGALGLAACGGDSDPTDYSQENEDVFMDSCVNQAAGADDAAQAMQKELCGCMYQYFVDNVPYAKFEEMDRAALTGGDTTELQEHTMKGLQQCIADMEQ